MCIDVGMSIYVEKMENIISCLSVSWWLSPKRGLTASCPTERVGRCHRQARAKQRVQVKTVASNRYFAIVKTVI